LLRLSECSRCGEANPFGPGEAADPRRFESNVRTTSTIPPRAPGRRSHSLGNQKVVRGQRRGDARQCDRGAVAKVDDGIVANDLDR
jgi:hypothetical protein